jgi:hypothetical protein
MRNRINSLRVLRRACAGLVLAALAACSAPPLDTTPMPGKVVDIAAFESFIAARPTPEQFRQRYPDVALILPGTITTKELRGDRSRYFATLDTAGRITGGQFQ